MPERFWKADTGEVDLKKALTEVEHAQSLVGRRFDQLPPDEQQRIVNEHLTKLGPPGRPKDPQAYEFTVPAEARGKFEIPISEEGQKTLRNFAYQAGLNQQNFERLVALASAVHFESLPDPQVELGKLGANYEQRVNRVAGWLEATLPPEILDAVPDSLAATAGFVQLVEHMMRLAGEPSLVPGDEKTQARQAGDTVEGLKQLMADPRYDPRNRGKFDQAFHNDVAQRWAKLHK